MNLSNLNATFEEFLSNIVLTETQASRIDSALAAISEIFLTHFEGDVEIYVQGSFATGTTVKPLTADQSNNPGEFDVDIVLERTSWIDAQSALTTIEDVLRSFDKYTNKLSNKNKESCVRLEYSPDQSTGVSFHVDIVPIKILGGDRKVAIRTANQWKTSDSKSLISWVKTLQDKQPYLTATIMALKRMRDVAGLTIELPSIVIFSLLESTYQQTNSYFDDLLITLSNIDKSFSHGLTNITVNNPVNHSEDIVSKWRKDPTIFDNVKLFIKNSLNNLTEALEVISENDIQDILSNDFPSNILPSYVHSLRSENLVIESSGDLKKGAISGSSKFGKKSRSNLWTFFERSKPIAFQAVGCNAEETILWQVCNDSGSDKLRGDFFEARGHGGSYGSSVDPAKNHENELYPGKHWIRFIGYRSDTNKVTTLGPKFYVDVKSSNGGQLFKR